jgi:flagellar FliJ protein
MKKFQFSLETVLDYKQQILDSLQAEHGKLLAQVHKQEAVLEQLNLHYQQENQSFAEKKAQGITVGQALMIDASLRVLERDIHRETLHLEELNLKAEEKRLQVVEAKQETASIEKLKEKKVHQYHQIERKNEEAMIDEFVSTTRVMAAQGA